MSCGNERVCLHCVLRKYNHVKFFVNLECVILNKICDKMNKITLLRETDRNRLAFAGDNGHNFVVLLFAETSFIDIFEDAQKVRLHNNSNMFGK